MFTESERQLIVTALLMRKSSVERAKSKASNPKFGPIYDEDLKALAALVMKVQALEVKK